MEGGGEIGHGGERRVEEMKSCTFDGVGRADGGERWMGIAADHTKAMAKWVGWVGCKEWFGCRGEWVKGIGGKVRGMEGLCRE